MSARIVLVRGRRSDEGGSLHWRVALAATLVGLGIVLGVAWIGPGLFAGDPGGDRRVVEARVIEPVPCTDAHATATVRFSAGGEQREASLNACGHDQDEHVDVAVPDDASNGLVHSADAARGHSDLYQPLGLLLLSLSCFGGGVYAFLLAGAARSR